MQIIHRVIASFLIKQAGLKPRAADTGALTLIQRFGSAANLNIHLHCLVLDGIYRSTGGEALFQEARAPTTAELHGLLTKIITRIMRALTACSRPTPSCAPRSCRVRRRIQPGMQPITRMTRRRL